MAMPGRKYTAAGGYRYGFNGQEKSDDVTVGNYTAMYWEYDARIGRRWNLDPVSKVGESEYACLGNNPINLSDVDGDDPGKPGKKSTRYDWSAALRYQAIHYNGARVAYNIYRARQQFGHYGTKYNDAYKEQISSRAAKSFEEQNMVVTGIDAAAYAKVIEDYYEKFEKGFNLAGDRTMRGLKFIFDNKYKNATDIFKPNLTVNEAYNAIKESDALLDDLTGTAYTIGQDQEERIQRMALWAEFAFPLMGANLVSIGVGGNPGLNKPIPLTRTFPNMATAKGGSNIVIQFGKTENQIYHTFRHTDALGLDRSLVQSTVQNHFKTVSSQVVTGKPFNQIIEIGGQRIQYTAFKLSDGTFNIGRIHGVK